MYISSDINVVAVRPKLVLGVPPLIFGANALLNFIAGVVIARLGYPPILILVSMTAIHVGLAQLGNNDTYWWKRVVAWVLRHFVSTNGVGMGRHRYTAG